MSTPHMSANKGDIAETIFLPGRSITRQIYRGKFSNRRSML